MPRALITAALVAFAITTTAVQASEQSSVPVTYGDLNLANPVDAKILADRLQTAAKQVCLDTLDHVDKADMHECVAAAVAIATAGIESNVVGSQDRALRASLINVREQVASTEYAN